MPERDVFAVAETEAAAPESPVPEGLGAAAELAIDWSDARYERLELLGRGGMGEVELLRDKRIGREIARKRMHPDLERDAGGIAMLRFLREATVQGRLEHPSIVPVYDLDRGPDGTTFTMKRIRGETLAAVLARGLVRDEVRLGRTTKPTTVGPRRWTLRAVLGALVQVARAVHFAHTRAVVHRDLKPANVMLGEFGEVYVLDWGLAKTLDGPLAAGDAAGRVTQPPIDPYAASTPPTASSVDAATQAGSFLGTLGYTAPEQIVNAAGVDARADVYALGAILFEVLAGEPLHPRINAAQLLGATLSEIDVPGRLGERAPPELVAVVSSAVSLSPAARPDDAGAIADALQSYLDGDRDLALRRALAKEHRDRAAQLAERASAARGEAILRERKEALSEVGRALALDPGDQSSMRMLVTLLETPPAEVPVEVRSALSSRESQNRAALASRGAVSWLAALAMVPALALMGVRSWVALVVLAAVAAAGALHAARASKKVETVIPLTAMFSGAVFIAAFSTIFGPLWLGVMAAVTCLVPWLTVGAASQRLHAIGFAVAGVAAPPALQLLGVLPQQYAIRDGALIVTPLLLDFAPGPTFAVLGLTSLLALLIVAQFATSFRDEVDRSETSLRLLAWQLRQLAPERPEA